MGQKLRYIPPSPVSACGMVEVTCRTLQARLLLKPSQRLCDVFFGVLARAQTLYPVKIHAVVCLSTHYHMLITPKDTQELARFRRVGVGGLRAGCKLLWVRRLQRGP